MNNWKVAVATGAMLAGLATSAFAAKFPVTPIEGSIESAANLLVVPSSNAGTLVVRGCPEDACQIRSLTVDANTRYVAGKTDVTPAKFSSVLSAAGEKPVTVHYRLSDSKVTRVVIMARIK